MIEVDCNPRSQCEQQLEPIQFVYTQTHLRQLDFVSSIQPMTCAFRFRLWHYISCRLANGLASTKRYSDRKTTRSTANSNRRCSNNARRISGTPNSFQSRSNTRGGPILTVAATSVLPCR